MALKFRKVERKLLAGESAGQVKTYAVAKSNGYCDLPKLCKLISARSSISSADVKAVLDSLNWVMEVELQSSNIVQVGELGNFRLTISSNGTDTADDFSAADIRKAKIVFSPGSSLRKAGSEVKYEEDKPIVITDDCERPHAD
ncbi:HU family DNA-binding protein [Parabacteroides sp. PF5-9]|uniref:HU family DNA-binding protein n=1 Tax=Parabacteroides sp. PF5-9 TaxID=1742404 RepID=UPI0024741FCE|nr:HU family DNA-binding protein [Parabacteroides sp. PF5-9]MDH6358181.1 putative histone-like DNA-binding protein [Parabacteroides sp. PF5-9]